MSEQVLDLRRFLQIARRHKAVVVVFLAADDSAWVTGEVIRASGGLK